jgi:hypothetical protein
MKRFILVLLFFSIIIFVAFPQNWFVGGSFNINFSENSFTANELERENESRRINISPEIGYRLNKFDIGIKPIIQYTYNEDNSVSDSSINFTNRTNYDYGIGLFTRHNIFTFFERLSIFGRFDLDYIYSNIQQKDERENQFIRKSETVEHSVRFYIRPIIEYKLTDRLSLYSSIIGSILRMEYRHSTWTRSGIGYDDTSKNHSINVTLPSTFNLSLTSYAIGFYFNF